MPGDPAAAEEAHEQAYETADGPESEAGEASIGGNRDFGSGPFACQSGFVFFRNNSQPRITADPTSTDQRVYLVYDATIPGTEQAAQTTYNTAAPSGATLRVGQGGVYFTALTGATWSTPRLLAPTPRGHQLFPDVNADGGYLHAVWHDSRNDPANSVQFPRGNDGRTRDAGRVRRCDPGYGHVRRIVRQQRRHVVGGPLVPGQPDAELRDVRRPPGPVAR